MGTAFDFSFMPRFETERAVLRAVRPAEDLTALFDLFADERVAQHTDTGPFAEVGEAIEVMDWIAQIFQERRGMRWAIALRGDDDQLVGTCGFNYWDREQRRAEIGYDLAHRHWGRGLMTEALRPMLRFGFEEMDLRRIEAGVTVGNEASARVLGKLGFREEGLLRQGGYWRGAYHDLRSFGLLRVDWEPAGDLPDERFR